MRYQTVVAALLLANLAAAPTTNPADHYRQAFAQLDARNDTSNVLDDIDQTPLDAKTAKFLKAREPAINLLRQATTMPPAQWEAFDGDMSTVLPPLNAARYAAQIAELQARMDLHNQRPAQAVDDMLAAMALARNIGLQKLLVSRLVEIGIELPAIDRFAAMIPSLPKEVIATLPGKLAALPAPATGKQMMDAEFAFGTLASAKQGVPAAMFAAAKPFYTAVGDAMTRPTEQFEQTVDAETTKLMLNPFVKIIGPSIKRAQPSMLALEIKRAMLDTAVAIELNGPDAVKQSKDLATGEPFEYAKTPGGFVLKSKAMNRNQPVKLVAGK